MLLIFLSMPRNGKDVKCLWLVYFCLAMPSQFGNMECILAAKLKMFYVNRVKAFLHGKFQLKLIHQKIICKACFVHRHPPLATPSPLFFIFKLAFYTGLETKTISQQSSRPSTPLQVLQVHMHNHLRITQRND